MKFWSEHASYPFKSHDRWFLTEDIRWGKFAPGDRHQGAGRQGQPRGSLARGGKGTGVAAADIPASPSRGIETFFDGKVFDPANPWPTSSLAIKRAVV